MTYMASCGDTTCDQYNSTNAEWFKIDETGLEPGNVTWYQQDISTSVLENVHITATLTCPRLVNRSPANVTIPSTLKSGQYLIRHEIIALHLATTVGGAEFYPSCTQVTSHVRTAPEQIIQEERPLCRSTSEARKLGWLPRARR